MKLQLRFHQELILRKTEKLIKDGHKKIVWACKPRSGKTYMTAGLVKKMKFNRVLITTSHPTEVRSQFVEELFSLYDEFKDYKTIDIKTSESTFTILDKMILFISKQLLQRLVEKEEFVNTMKDKFDVIFFDENHEGGTTKKTQDMINTICPKEVLTIYLTGTPNKTIKKWEIIPDAQLFWTLEDEKMCQDILDNIFCKDYFIDKHGIVAKHLIDDLMRNDRLEESLQYYINMPKLCYLTVLFEREKITSLLPNEVFSFASLLKCDSSAFVNEKEVTEFLQYITEMVYPRIKSRIKKEGSRECQTELWFLPPNGVDQISKCLKKILSKMKYFKGTEVFIVNSKQTFTTDVKTAITNLEQQYKRVIVLAGSMLQLGVSLKKCDVVMLFNDTSSSDKLIQETFRSMTEDVGKKVGFVVDLYPGRIMQVIQHSDTRGVGVKEALATVVNNNLLHIDVDNLHEEELDVSELMEKLIEEWIKMPIHTYTTILQRLDEELGEFDEYTQNLISNCFQKVVSTKEMKVTIYEKEKISTKSDSTSGGKVESDELFLISEKEINERAIFFRKEVLPYVIQLVSVLTVKENKSDFIQLLKFIKEDEDLIDCFNEQTSCLWKEEGMIDTIIKISQKLNNAPINDICLSIKLKIKSLIDYPAELLNLINDCLKPRDIEKRKFGEVFTPLDFINDKMLHHINEYWKKKHINSIFSNKDLKWFDPAAGMGNYPVAIYYKLMEGLKEEFPDDGERKRWILEKMIYMGELNKKNNYILTQIFNMSEEYKLNLYRGDTLQINLKEVFNIDRFDVVIGNPPYNEEFKSKTSSPLYHKFIYEYINKTRLMSYIIPSRWFGGGKGLDKFREWMLGREDIVYIKHIDDASDIFGNSVDIKGGVNYFLIDEKSKGMCEYTDEKLKKTTLLKLNKYDILVDSRYYGVIEKLLMCERLVKYYRPSNYFGIETNDERLLETPEKNTVKCYVSKLKGFEKYILKSHIKKDMSKWKVVTPRASFQHGSGFGNVFIVGPGEVCSHTYIFFEVESEDEAKSLRSYLLTKLPNVMLSLRKVSQDISEGTCKWIPVPELTSESERELRRNESERELRRNEWSDEEVYQYFGLSEEEIQIIKDTQVYGY